MSTCNGYLLPLIVVDALWTIATGPQFPFFHQEYQFVIATSKSEERDWEVFVKLAINCSFLGLRRHTCINFPTASFILINQISINISPESARHSLYFTTIFPSPYQLQDIIPR